MRTRETTRREALAGIVGVGAAALAGRALAQAGSPPEPAPASSHFGFTKLVVGDLGRSAAFYERVCGLVESSRIDTESGGRKLTEILFEPTAPGGATFVLIHYPDSPQPVRGELILGFQTNDIEAFVARAEAAGGAVERDVWEIPEMKLRVAFVTDVEGHTIEVVQPLA